MKARVVNVNDQVDAATGNFMWQQLEMSMLSEQKVQGKTNYIPTNGSVVMNIRVKESSLQLKVGDVVDIDVRKSS